MQFSNIVARKLVGVFEESGDEEGEGTSVSNVMEANLVQSDCARDTEETRTGFTLEGGDGVREAVAEDVREAVAEDAAFVESPSRDGRFRSVLDSS